MHVGQADRGRHLPWHGQRHVSPATFFWPILVYLWASFNWVQHSMRVGIDKSTDTFFVSDEKWSHHGDIFVEKFKLLVNKVIRFHM